MNEKDIEELQRQSDYVYQNRLTGTKDDAGTEKGAIEAYTRGGYVVLNGSLHDPSIVGQFNPGRYFNEDWAVVARAVESLDSAIAKSNIEADITVFRGDAPEHFEGWNPGTVQCFPAFMSTSALESKAEEFADGLMLEIYLSKGTRGMYIGTNSAVHKDEAEFLLGRKLKFKILERTSSTLNLEVLP